MLNNIFNYISITFTSLALIDLKIFHENFGKEDTLVPHIDHMNYTKYIAALQCQCPLVLSVQVDTLRNRYVCTFSGCVYLMTKINVYSFSIFHKSYLQVFFFWLVIIYFYRQKVETCKIFFCFLSGYSFLTHFHFLKDILYSKTYPILII